MKDIKQTQQGSGSAENKGGSRSDQKHTTTSPGNSQKQDIAQDINEPSSHIAGVKDMGQLSGRDDYAGGSNDGMSAESSDEETDR